MIKKWVYYCNSNASKQWLRPHQPAKIIVEENRFGSKVMLCVWWNFEGVIHWKFVPNGRGVDADLYSQQLERVHEILRRRYQLWLTEIEFSLRRTLRDTILNEQP